MISNDARFDRETASQLIENGYSPIPVVHKTKHPAAIGNWRRYCWTQPSEADVSEWSKNHNGASVGLACGNSVVGLDLDCRDDHRVAKLLALANEHLGASPLVRAGRPGRVGVLYRCAEPILSGGYNDIDVLGLGTQLVVFGIHPRTKRDYAWNDGIHPLNTPASELPTVDNEMLNKFVEAVAKMDGRTVMADGRLTIDSINITAPLSSLTVLVTMIYSRYRNGRYPTQSKARSVIDSKYADTGSGLKVIWDEKQGD
ncbi:MAG: bifunctional DNA primase/polymerase [Pseudomonadota bacterium]